MRLVVSQAAAADLARLHAFLADKNPAAADRSIAVLVAAIQSIDTFPQRGRPSGTPNVRELIVPFGGAGYVLRYAYSAQRDEVIVLRISHGREAR
ncbi:MAG: type II toxin-antitoxin system RelE/ParE family toxin [Beijerinckiaceae bacterium]